MPTDTESLDSTARRKATGAAAVNFSRPNFSRPTQPRIQSEQQQQQEPIELEGSHVKSVKACYERADTSKRRHDDDLDDRPMPDEPRFSIDSTTYLPSASSSGSSSLTWNSKRNELTSQRHPNLRTEDQRYPHPKPPTRNASTSSTTTTTTEQQQRNPIPKDRPPTLTPKSILKSTSVEVTSEPKTGGESTSTVSDGGSGSFDEDGKWHASDYDTSCLSEKEVKRLLRKGINPSLYLEMRAARRGRGVVGALTGSTYVS